MALAAVADDGDFLALDEIEVGVPIVINAHFLILRWRFQRYFVDEEGKAGTAAPVAGFLEKARGSIKRASRGPPGKPPFLEIELTAAVR